MNLLLFFVTIVVSFIAVRIGAIAFELTGLEWSLAKFQALSCFTGTGFTTKEAEFVMKHPVRRKIVTWLMIMGNAGIVTVIVTATSSLATSRGYQLPINVLILVVGVFLIYKIATYRKFTRGWEHFIEKKLVKSPTFEEAATEDLLHFLEGYGLVKKIISEDSPLIGSTLSECKLNERGLLVLGIERGKDWIPTPKAREKIEEGDSIIVYGPLDILKNLLKEER